jgi:hypothetical protein
VARRCSTRNLRTMPQWRFTGSFTFTIRWIRRSWVSKLPRRAAMRLVPAVPQQKPPMPPRPTTAARQPTMAQLQQPLATRLRGLAIPPHRRQPARLATQPRRQRQPGLVAAAGMLSHLRRSRARRPRETRQRRRLAAARLRQRHRPMALPAEGPSVGRNRLATYCVSRMLGQFRGFWSTFVTNGRLARNVRPIKLDPGPPRDVGLPRSLFP